MCRMSSQIFSKIETKKNQRFQKISCHSFPRRLLWFFYPLLLHFIAVTLYFVDFFYSLTLSEGSGGSSVESVLFVIDCVDFWKWKMTSRGYKEWIISVFITYIVYMISFKCYSQQNLTNFECLWFCVSGEISKWMSDCTFVLLIGTCKSRVSYTRSQIFVNTRGITEIFAENSVTDSDYSHIQSPPAPADGGMRPSKRRQRTRPGTSVTLLRI